MLTNYLKIAFRSLLRNRTYAFINIFGLSAGIAVSLIIFLFVVHESSFDHFHPKAEKIYLMGSKVNFGGQIIQMTGMSAGMGPTLKLNHPEVKNYVRVYNVSSAVIQSDEQHISNEPKFIFADTALFTMFQFPLLSGSYQALARPNTVLISSAVAKKYFGSADPIGKTLFYKQTTPLEVAGVLSPLPSNSDFDFGFVASFSTLGNIASEKQNYSEEKPDVGNYATYLLVDNASSLPKLTDALKGDDILGADKVFIFRPLLTLHQSNAYLYLFLATAFIILFLALINYMNLTTATATLRSREVGVRKVIGAQRHHLATQFYFESAIITVIAFALAFAWMELLLPVFLNSLGLKIDTSFLTQPVFISVSAGLLLFCIFLAGSYPSLILSRFNPVNVLKGKASSAGSTWLRKGFTVFQFAVSVSLIMITLGIQRQLEFMRNQSIGLNKDQVMVFSLTIKNGSAYTSIKNDIRNLSGVKQVAAATLPLYTKGNSAVFMKTPTTHEDVFMNILNIDENFISALNIKWIEKPDTLAKRGYIVNEAALEKLKITQDDKNAVLDLGGDQQFPVLGVVKNFNYEMSHQKVNGLIFQIASDTSTAIARHGASLYVRMDPKTNLRDNVAAIEKIFRHHQTGQPFEYYFLDDAFQKLFQTEDRLARIFDVFTGVAIILACLGLFGLITFSVQVRTKEIGIRKVLGANARTIFSLLSREFILLILAGVAIAIPVAIAYTNHWLTQFATRTTIPWWLGLIAALAAILLALITISFQVVKAALTNPVTSLRSE